MSSDPPIGIFCDGEWYAKRKDYDEALSELTALRDKVRWRKWPDEEPEDVTEKVWVRFRNKGPVPAGEDKQRWYQWHYIWWEYFAIGQNGATWKEKLETEWLPIPESEQENSNG